MSYLPKDFRAVFPAFREETKYPDAQIDFYLDLGGKMFSVDRWQDQLQFGLFLFVAHNLVLDKRDELAEEAGGTSGQATGAISAKAVDRVSISYSNASTMMADAGAWNLTTYGQRLYNLIRVVGIGGMQSAPGFNDGTITMYTGGGAFQF